MNIVNRIRRRRPDAAQLAAEAERRCLAATGKRTPPSMDESGVHHDAKGTADRMMTLVVWLAGIFICYMFWMSVYYFFFDKHK